MAQEQLVKRLDTCVRLVTLFLSIGQILLDNAVLILVIQLQVIVVKYVKQMTIAVVITCFVVQMPKFAWTEKLNLNLVTIAMPVHQEEQQDHHQHLILLQNPLFLVFIAIMGNQYQKINKDVKMIAKQILIATTALVNINHVKTVMKILT